MGLVTAAPPRRGGRVNRYVGELDWRTVLDLERDDLLTSHWDPLAGSPRQDRHYPVVPLIQRSADTTFHAVRLAGAAVRKIEHSLFARDPGGFLIELVPSADTRDAQASR